MPPEIARARITPACAGKRSRGLDRPARRRDHPRVRGEKYDCDGACTIREGSPPRARGKVAVALRVDQHRGITPACAGKRPARCPRRLRCGDHPRVRGEKSRAEAVKNLKKGSPPRARGKARPAAASRPRSGITPACAGKSKFAFRRKFSFRDHPRVRGEKVDVRPLRQNEEGSPPRARGKVKFYKILVAFLGITPACAGKSQLLRISNAHTGDHPRVRGEKAKCGARLTRSEGSPPRARGKGCKLRHNRIATRITPACAGKRLHIVTLSYTIWDHPRVRGEKLIWLLTSEIFTGSPPRARGKGRALPKCPWVAGITPACAGKRQSAEPGSRGRRDHPRVRGEK